MSIRVAVGIGLALCLAGQPASASAGVGECIDVRDVTPPATPCAAPGGPECTDDDRPAIDLAIRLALASGGPHAVCFPGGAYDIRSTGPGGASFDLGDVGGVPAAGLLLVGQGNASLRMSAPSITGTWVLFRVGSGASGVTFRDLALDGSGATGATSAILVQIGSGAADAARGISVDGAVLRGSRGAAIQVSGSGVDGVSVTSTRLESNVGAAIHLRDGAKNILVGASSFANNSGHDVSATASSSPLGRIILRGNVIVRSGTGSPVSISLLGDAGNPATETSAQGNLVVNGRMKVAGFDRIAIIDNVILGGSASTPEHVVSIGHARSIILRSNFMTNESTTAASVLHADANGVDGPGRASIDGNVLIQRSNAPIARINWVRDAVFTGNQLHFTSPTLQAATGLTLGSAASLTSHLVVSRNAIMGNLGAGSLSSAFDIATGDVVFAHVLVTGNVSQGAVKGVTFAAAASSSSIPLVGGNEFFGSSVDMEGFSAQLPAAAMGGNVAGSGAQMLTGSGIPTANAPTGSLFQERGAGGLYVRDNSTGTWSQI